MIEWRTANADIHWALPSEFGPLRTFLLKIEWLPHRMHHNPSKGSGFTTSLELKQSQDGAGVDQR